MAIPEEPLVRIYVAPPETITIEKPFELPLNIAADDPSVTVLEAPEGLQVVDGKLLWTPLANQVGDHTIKLDVNKGAAYSNWETVIRVERPSLPLPIKPNTIIISPNERYAIAANLASPQEQLSTTLMLVDIREQTVVTTRQLSERINAMTMDDDHAYLGFAGQVVKLSLPTLETVNQRDIGHKSWDSRTQLEWHAGLPAVEQPPAERNLDGSPPPNRAKSSAFLSIRWMGSPDEVRMSTDDLRHLPSVAPQYRKIETSAQTFSSIDGRCGDSWIVDGVLWDSSLTKPQLLVYPFSMHFSNNAKHSIKRDGEWIRILTEPNRWHPFRREWLGRDKPTQVYDKNHSTAAKLVCPRYPAQLEFTTDETMGYLDAYDLFTGQLLQSLPVANKRTIKHPQENWKDRHISAVTASANYCLFCQEQALCFVPIASLGEPLVPSFHIKPVQSTLELASNAPAKVRYAAEGALKFKIGCNPLAFRPNNSFEHYEFTLESPTGEFDIDFRPHLIALVDSYLLEIGNVLGLVRGPGGRHLAPLISESRQCFERLVGRKPSGVPISVHVWVIAESKDLETSMIAHDYLIDVPTRIFKERLSRKYPEPKGKPQVPGRDAGKAPLAI